MSLTMPFWSKQNVKDFIDLYRSQECLWKIKSIEYKNKYKREKAYDKIAQYCRTFDPKANRDTVVRKINNLRTSYRKELRKQLQSRLSISEPDEVYVPSLWYFDEFIFLREQEISNTTDIHSNTPPLHEVDGTSDSELNSQDVPAPVSPKMESMESLVEVGGSESDGQEAQPQLGPSPVTLYSSQHQNGHQANTQSKRKREQCDNDNNELVRILAARLPNPEPRVPEDQFDTFGKNIASRLRSLPLDQRIHAQKYISDIIYEAELGQLYKMPDQEDMLNHNSSSPTPPSPTSAAAGISTNNSDILQSI